MENSEDPDQTAAVWSGSALFAQAYLSENLGSLRVYLIKTNLFALINVSINILTAPSHIIIHFV